jgi:hypothetical protein
VKRERGASGGRVRRPLDPGTSLAQRRPHDAIAPLLDAHCCGVLAAQRASPEVTDLVSVAASRSRGGADQLVLRAELPGGRGVRHVVAGEGHLAGDPRAGLRPVRPFFTERTLVAQVNAMRSGSASGCEFVVLGARTLVRAPEVEQVEAALAELRRALPAPLRCQFRLESLTDGGAVVVLNGDE